MVTGVPGEKPEHRCPLYIKTSNCCLPDRRKYDDAEWKGVDIKKKNPNSLPSRQCHCICGDPEGANSNAGVRRPSIRGSSDGWRTPAFRFLTLSAVTIPRSPGLGFLNISDHTTVSQTGFLLLFWPRTSVTIPQTQSVRPGYGHWHPSIKYL